ncbi:MAG: type II toxin-antitoxin system Phd/YefM family antitoxin [bacterium]|nr:type II toxin-antitoxin system Phd/YefM family antitoxin [bacterium]
MIFPFFGYAADFAFNLRIYSAYCNLLIIQDYIPITKAKAAFLDIIRKIEGSEDAIAITKNGVPEAVLLSMAKFEGLLEKPCKIFKRILSPAATCKKNYSDLSRLKLNGTGFYTTSMKKIPLFRFITLGTEEMPMSSLGGC